MSTTTKKPTSTTAKKTGANAKGANAKKGANSKGANAKGANSKGANAKAVTKPAAKANSGALKPSEMAKKIGLKRVGFNQWKNGKDEVVARTDSDQGILVPTRKGIELGFDPMAEFKKAN